MLACAYKKRNPLELDSLSLYTAEQAASMCTLMFLQNIFEPNSLVHGYDRSDIFDVSHRIKLDRNNYVCMENFLGMELYSVQEKVNIYEQYNERFLVHQELSNSDLQLYITWLVRFTALILVTRKTTDNSGRLKNTWFVSSWKPQRYSHWSSLLTKIVWTNKFFSHHFNPKPYVGDKKITISSNRAVARTVNTPLILKN